MNSTIFDFLNAIYEIYSNVSSADFEFDSHVTGKY